MKILYFAPIPYSALKQRPQFLAEQLAKRYEVWYVEPTISILKSVREKNGLSKGDRRDVSPRLHIVRLDGHFMAYRSLELFDPLHLNTVSERIQLHRLTTEADVVWVGYPAWYSVVCEMRDKKLIYDKMDDNAQLTKNGILRKLILRNEPKLIRRADYVFVAAQHFYEEIRPVNSNTFLLPNAVDLGFPVPKEKPRDPQKRVFGYVGTIGHWFDFAAVEAILRADERNYVVLVGPVARMGPEHSRLSYLGTVPHGRIPELIQTFDVCLCPFLRNELLDTINPVKIYEYLAMNKPVLAVKSPETEKFGAIVTRYEKPEELRALAGNDLRKPFGTEEERKDFVNRNSWEARGMHLFSIIQAKELQADL